MKAEVSESEDIIIFEVNKENEKLEYYLKETYGVSSRLIRKMVKNKSIYLNGEMVKRNISVRKGDKITLIMGDEEDNNLPDEDVKLEIIYEDYDIIALNKHPFTVVHTTKNHYMGTIANGVSSYFIEKGIKKSVRFINRLDRDTSGVLLIGKNSFAHQQIANQFKSDSIEKWYLVVVDGLVVEDEGVIEAPIDIESGEHAMKRVVIDTGKYSKTHYKVIERYKKNTLLKVKLETGRTHQIRVHLSHIGHPIIGDTLYFKESEYIKRQALHSYSLKFRLPRAQESVEIIAELPEDIKRLLKIFKNEE